MHKVISAFCLVSISASLMAAPTANEDFVVAEDAKTYANAVKAANEAVRTNEVTVALVAATNDLTEAIQHLTPKTREEIEAALGWRVVALVGGPAVQFANSATPLERDRYEAILGYRIRMREDGTPTIEFVEL